MLTILKLSFSCFLILLLTSSYVLSSPVDDLDSTKEKGKLDGITAKSMTPIESTQETTISPEDIAQFLRDMKLLNDQATVSNLSHSVTAGPFSGTTKTAEASVKAVETHLGVMISVVIGATAAGLLLILAIMVVAIFVCAKGGKMRKKDLSLNKDLNRWDPQLLRPSKDTINAFIFGSPIPSVAEMIKQ